MGIYWRLLAHAVGEAQTYESAAGTLQASPYTPDEDAQLVGIRVWVAPEAATSLVENFQVRLTCTTFKPNTIHVAGCGNGLATAPSIPAPIFDYTCDQPVKSGVPITIETRHAVATAVTCNMMIMGMFRS